MINVNYVLYGATSAKDIIPFVLITELYVYTK